MPQIRMPLPRPILSSHALHAIAMGLHPPCVESHSQRDFMAQGAKAGALTSEVMELKSHRRLTVMMRIAAVVPGLTAPRT
jgi:hypothetical protein